MATLKYPWLVRDVNDHSLAKYTTCIIVSTIRFVSSRADRAIQTDETKVKLLLSNHSDQDLHNCHSLCAFV